MRYHIIPALVTPSSYERAVDALVAVEEARTALPEHPIEVLDTVTNEVVTPWSISQWEFAEWVQRAHGA